MKLSFMRALIRNCAYAIYPTRPVQYVLGRYVKGLSKPRPGLRRKESNPIRREKSLEPDDFGGLTASLIFSRTHWNPESIHHNVGTGRMQKEVFACLQEFGFEAEFAGEEDLTFSKRVTKADLVITIPSALVRIAGEVRGATALFTCNTHVLVRTARLVETARRWGLPCEYYPPVPMTMKAYNEADYLLIAENDHGIENFVRNGIKREKIIRYNNCVDDDIWVPGDSRREVFTFVCWASALGIRKGLPALVAAWKEWFSDQKAELHIWGIPTRVSDKMFNSLRQGSPGPGMFIHLDTFPAQDPQVIKFLGESHVGVYPTLEDAQPSALLEMASCGLPIITTKESGVEFSEDFCTYVAPDDVGELVKAFQYWYENRNLVDEAGHKARRFIQQRHTWNHLHKRFREIIDDVVLQRSASSPTQNR